MTHRIRRWSILALEILLRTDPLHIPPPGQQADAAEVVSVPPDEALSRLAALPFLQVTVPSIWLLSDRVLRVADVTVAGQPTTVITSTDEPGPTLADSLTIKELIS